MSDNRYLITGYIPSLPMACVGGGLFGAVAVALWIHHAREARKYMLVLCISVTTMSVGMFLRLASWSDPYSVGAYVPHTLIVLLSPCGFLANNYVILPRLATSLDAEQFLFLPSRIITRLFVWSDVITFVVQLGGSGLTAAGSDQLRNIGHWVALAGLIFQLVSFSLFVLLTVVFGLRIKFSARHLWRDSRDVGVQKASWRHDWRVLWASLLYTSVGIMIRCVYRVAEYTQGYEGTLRTTEVYFWVLDSLPLFIVILVWIPVWPPRYLEEMPSRDTMEIPGMSPKYASSGRLINA